MTQNQCVNCKKGAKNISNYSTGLKYAQIRLNISTQKKGTLTKKYPTKNITHITKNVNPLQKYI
nr:MAG TPA: hypothetical protein [Bacteriophage sp.]